ncbi:M4 family metallopeptidase [Mycolicibacterium pulveris]|uniref:M4 family metallopeptidase n=1 Tax=Mycolicibacterium pulveris TaxID=36813 RepID=UPI003CE9D259
MADEQHRGWVRVGAATAGLSVALMFGPGVAVAAPDASTDTATTTTDTDTDTDTGSGAEDAAATPDVAEAPDADSLTETLTLPASAAVPDDTTDPTEPVDDDTEVDTEEPEVEAADEVPVPAEPASTSNRDSSLPAAAESTPLALAVPTPSEQSDETPPSTETDSGVVAAVAVTEADPAELAAPAALADPEPVTLVIDVITERTVRPNVFRTVTLAVLGLFGFNPDATGSSPNPLVPALDAIWGLYRRIETGVANVLDRVGLSAFHTTTTYVTTLIVPTVYTAADLHGVPRVFAGGYSAELDKHFLTDTTRDITTYTAVTYVSGNVHYPVDPPGDIVVLASGWDPSAVSAHANMAVVYDFYVGTLAHDSFDDTGAPIAVTVISHVFNNAYWYRAHEVFVFGHDYEGALDIVGHEYTHAVIDSVVKGQHGEILGQDAQSLALEEAYSDILGTLIEGKAGPDRWLIAEDYGCASPRAHGCAIRNLADPQSLGGTAHFSEFVSGGSAHRNSTIFSHAAYRMMTDVDTASVSDEVWAQVFYGSLYRLTPGASFAQAAAAVVAEAEALGFDADEMAAVRRAYSDVGLTVPDPAATIAV